MRLVIVGPDSHHDAVAGDVVIGVKTKVFTSPSKEDVDPIDSERQWDTVHLVGCSPAEPWTEETLCHGHDEAARNEPVLWLTSEIPVFIVISKSRHGRETNVACFATRSAAEQEIEQRKGEWKRNGWSKEDTPYYFIDKHELRS